MYSYYHIINRKYLILKPGPVDFSVTGRDIIKWPQILNRKAVDSTEVPSAE